MPTNRTRIARKPKDSTKISEGCLNFLMFGRTDEGQFNKGEHIRLFRLRYQKASRKELLELYTKNKKAVHSAFDLYLKNAKPWIMTRLGK